MNEKKSLLLHIHKLDGGGAERQLTYLAKGLTERGWNVHVVTLYSGGVYWDSLKTVEGCILHSLNRKGKKDFSVIPKLRNYIKQQKVDAVQGWMPPCNSFASIAAWWAGVPSFMAVRAADNQYGFGARLFLKSDKYFAKYLAKVVIYNSYRGKTHYSRMGYPAHNAMVVPNGLLFPEGVDFSKPLNTPPWKLAMVARFDPVKDHNLMFDALSRLRLDDYPVELHLYGEGNNVMEAQLRSKADELGVDAYIHWHGFSTDIWRALNNTDILVSVSKSEGLSNTLLEGMAACRPIVATNVGDAKTLLGGNNERGILIPKEDITALVTGIKMIIDTKDRAVTMGKNAAGFVVERYTIAAMVDKYESLYRQHIEHGRN